MTDGIATFKHPLVDFEQASQLIVFSMSFAGFSLKGIESAKFEDQIRIFLKDVHSDMRYCLSDSLDNQPLEKEDSENIIAHFFEHYPKIDTIELDSEYDLVVKGSYLFDSVINELDFEPHVTEFIKNNYHSLLSLFLVNIISYLNTLAEDLTLSLYCGSNPLNSVLNHEPATLA